MLLFVTSKSYTTSRYASDIYHIYSTASFLQQINKYGYLHRHIFHGLICLLLHCLRFDLDKMKAASLIPFFKMGFCLLVFLICHASGSYVRPLPRSTLSVALDTKSSTDPQQVHISLSGNDHMRISWMTKDDAVSSIVDYGTSSGTYTSSAKGEETNYRYLTYKSANIHHVVIGPLEADTIYYYRCGGNGPEYSFKTPPVQLPIAFAVVGDLGQTEWTDSTLQHLQRMNYDVLLLPGDLSYADDWQPLWDSFGRLVEPMASARPWMVTQGNHEVEKIPILVTTPFKAYNARWKMPYQESGSASNLYYSFEVAGAHILMLGSYTDFGPDSDQYKWLQGDLSRVNRRRTPWLIALIHAPWYNTNSAHQGEGDDMKEAMEQLLHAAKVDIVFAGHVHAYERFTRVYKNQANPCGAVHITIGDGGNREGLASEYQNPPSRLSVFREASFGHGELVIYNVTHARWTWHRNDEDEPVISDEVWMNSIPSVSNSC